MSEPSPARTSSPLPALAATLWAGATLAVCETSFALGWRWEYPAGYLPLSWALTLAFSLVVGVIGSRLLAPSWCLVAWGAAGAALASGVASGVGVGLATAFVATFLSTTRVRARSDASFVGACTGAGFFLMLVLTRTIESALGLDAWPAGTGEAVTAAGLVASVPLALSLALGRLERAPAVALAFGVTALAALASALPALNAPTGLHRLPPADYATSTPRAAGEHPNVFLLVLDTVRADRLSVYGYGRETTPQLARWLGERPNAVLVPNAYANGSWTVPSHASLFTARLPNEHGAHFALDGSVRWRFGIEDELPTLAERLHAAGYATLGTFANNWLRIVAGMGRGFERYFRSHHADPLPGIGEGLRRAVAPGAFMDVRKFASRAETVNATLLSMVEPWSAGPNPLFVFANYGDAHGPYAPPRPFRGRFHPVALQERPGHLALDQTAARREVLAARYDEEIAYLDAQLGALFEQLDALGLLASSWIFVTSDHGEAFGEHGVTEHGTGLHDEVVRIPLLVFPPDGVRLDVPAGAVSLVDVGATIAAIAGTDLPGPGRDLRASAPAPPTARLEFYGDRRKAAIHGELSALASRAIVEWPFKLVERGDELELFDLAADPGERTNLATERPELVERLRAALPAFGEPVSVSGDAASASDLEDLRGLGYVGDDEH